MSEQIVGWKVYRGGPESGPEDEYLGFVPDDGQPVGRYGGNVIARALESYDDLRRQIDSIGQHETEGG